MERRSARNLNVKKHRNVTRFEYGRTAAWWVRVERQGRVIARLFSDRAHGGKRRALRAAIEYRDRVLAVLPPAARARHEVGPGYVRRTLYEYTSATGRKFTQEVWIAWIRVAPSRAASTKYSIERWGPRKAKALALAWLEGKRIEQKRNFARARKGKR